MAKKKIQQGALSLSSADTVTLNDQQQGAVTHTTGPLLIIAGAGTGKTKTLTKRIAWLIQEKLAQPSEILALTFTDKAAGEMETRVDELLPYGQTDATISTFNAFGDSILREHTLDLGLPPDFQILGATEQELFLAERFDQIEGLTELRPISSPRKFVGPILQVISRAKDELVTPQRYAEVANYLRSNAKDEDEAREATRQVDLATIYRAYESLKAERGVIDFGDQMLLLHRLLDERPIVQKRLRQRYKFILVDEFQDTNVAQYRLVKRLLGPQQNLTVVGDDDQAIYKFRGAAVSNILGFLEDFPKAQQIILTQNYRSTQAILDIAYKLVIHNNPDRLEPKLGIDKHLVGESKGIVPNMKWYQHEADELAAVVETVKSRMEKVKCSEIAILVRSNNLIGPIAQSLTKADIPYVASRDTSFVNLPEVRGIAAFLSVLVRSDDSLGLLKLMLSPYYAFPVEWVLPLSNAARRSNRPLHDVLFDQDSVAWPRIPKEGIEPLQNLRSDLGKYRALIGTKNPGEILYSFLKDRGVLEEKLTPPGKPVSRRPASRGGHPRGVSVLSEVDRLVQIQNIAAVFDAISGYLTAQRDPFLFSFVDDLPNLLTTIKPPSTAAGPDVDAVQLMTVHAAKGLEFDTVFLPSLMADRFPARRRAQALELPTELIAEQLPTGDEHLQEERRLMYVAMTRAKRQLYLSGSERVGTGLRPKKVSPFVIEALELDDAPTPIVGDEATTRITNFAPIVPVMPTAAYPSYGGVLFLSPAAIEAYLADPYNFYWRYVLKAPQAPSRHLVYGNAIHSAIEAYYHARRKLMAESHSNESSSTRSHSSEVNSPVSSEVGDRMLASNSVTSGESGRLLDAALARYAEAWKHEGFESQIDANRQFEHGRETIERFVARASREPLPDLVEYSFTLGLPSVKIKGRIDALFSSVGEIRDFKTSQVATQKEADKKVHENIPIRIYALAFQTQFDRLPSALVLDFVEHDLKASLTPSEKVLEETKRLVQHAVEGIKAGHFDPNPNNPFKDYS